MRWAGHFDNCQFGPADLRPLFREIAMPGERCVGWGAVHESGLFPVVASAVLALIPIAGQLFSTMFIRKITRFVILTDTRILILASDYRTKRIGGERVPIGVALNVPLNSVMVTGLGRRKLRIWSREWQRPLRYAMTGRERGPAGRLSAGLRILADGPIDHERRVSLRTIAERR